MEVDVKTLLTIIFVLMDDWCRQKDIHQDKEKPGAKLSRFHPRKLSFSVPQTPDLKCGLFCWLPIFRPSSCWRPNRCQWLVVSRA